MKRNLASVFFIVLSFSLAFTSCNSNPGYDKKENPTKKEIVIEVYDSTKVVKTDEKIEEKGKSNLEGIYVNSAKTTLKISKATKKGFFYECEMKSECGGGYEKIKGFASYLNLNKAVSNSASEYEGEVFYIEKDVIVRFEPCVNLIGMECQRFFDTEFSKK